MMTNLLKLFEEWSGENPVNVSKLPQSGSDRIYYRISGHSKSALAAYNQNVFENYAFIIISNFFKEKKLNVPEIYKVDKKLKYYLLQDLGDKTIFDMLFSSRNGEDIPENIINLYKSAIQELIKFQIYGKNLDFSYAYPVYKFDNQSIMWDLYYFKYYFLKLQKIYFDELALEFDFQRFTEFLLKTDTNFFMYRDFQSRNIMIVDDKPYFIDYQGGRKGALQYDIASLLFSAKTDLPPKLREDLYEFYINELQKFIKINPDKFKKFYNGYILIRILQTLGAYGFRGYYEKKEYFLNSIPYAIKNLDFVLNNYKLPIKLPVLNKSLIKIVDFYKKTDLSVSEPDILCVNIKSFSYKKGIPVDYSGHGGGFVFDCRSLPNPGKYEEYKTMTGKDQTVIDFLQKEQEVKYFFKNVFNIIDKSVEKYINRDFKHLAVNFGCTGGQHRSVFAAEQLYNHIKEKFDVEIKLEHTNIFKSLNY